MRGNTEWNYFGVNPMFDLLRVGEIVQLGVLLPLVGPVEPEADLQGEEEGHEAGSHQHGAWGGELMLTADT